MEGLLGYGSGSDSSHSPAAGVEAFVMLRVGVNPEACSDHSMLHLAF